MQLGNLLNKYVNNKPVICSDCGKKCRDKKSCLVTQVVNEINIERKNTKWKPVSYISVLRKLNKKSESDIYICLSNCRDYKNRNGSFGKCFWGSLKNTLQEKK